MNLFALQTLSYGVYLVSAMDKDRPVGCIANCAMQITAEPPSVAVSISHDNFTNACIKKRGCFALSVLTEKTSPALIGRFGFRSGRDIDKFAGVEYRMLGGLPVLVDACACVLLKVSDTLETDTHTIFLGKVLDAESITDDPPMTYAYYHRVIKGKSPQNAPTHISEKAPERNTASTKYICSVCGYVYDGSVPFEDLSDDWKCPLCLQPKAVFRAESV